MSWWTETRDGVLAEVGLATPSQVAATATGVAKAALGSNGVKQEIQQVQTNPFQAAAQGLGISQGALAGISLPMIALILGGAYFVFKK